MDPAKLANITADEQERRGLTPIWKYNYWGFMLDLLELIKVQYKKDYGKDFPEYEITTAKLFTNYGKSGGSDGGKKMGFGYKELPKASANKADGDGEPEEAGKFGGIVQEVACHPVINQIPNQQIMMRNSLCRTTLPWCRWHLPLRGIRSFHSRSRSLIRFLFRSSWRNQSCCQYFQESDRSSAKLMNLCSYHFWKFITVLEYSVWICIAGAYFFHFGPPLDLWYKFSLFIPEWSWKVSGWRWTEILHPEGILLVLYHVPDSSGWRRSS